VALTVTDNGGKTNSVTRSVIAQDPPVASPIGHVGSAATAGNSANPAVTIPATTAVGDRLVLALSMNNPTRTFTNPAGVTGWTKLDTVVADTVSTTVWTKVAQAGDPGTSVRVPMSGSAKFTLTNAAYSEVDSTPTLAFAAEPDLTEHAVRSTPLVNAPPGSWLVSYWADKSSTTTAWTPEASVTTRRAVCAADGGRICSALADSAGAVPSGPNGTVTASTGVASDMATTWSIVLAPSDGVPTNQQPVADFSSSCTLLDCSFDSSDSDDPDGAIASYSWDFGDGGTSTLANPDHSFAAAGTSAVTLTVTDNQDATDSVTTDVVVEEEAVESPVAFVGSAATTGNIKSPTVTIPAATTPGDRLLLALSMNNLTRTVSNPSGWTRLDTVVAGSMGTTFWTKVAVAGDPGSAVTVPLSGAAKFTLTVASYTGTAAGPVAFAGSADTAQHSVRSTPGVSAPEGAWVVSYWADKSSTTTAWTPAGSVTTRRSLCGADGGRICSALADSAAAVPSTYGNITASTGTASDMATTWSIVLAPVA
jgi:PKD repeat protein